MKLILGALILVVLGSIAGIIAYFVTKNKVSCVLCPLNFAEIITLCNLRNNGDNVQEESSQHS